jgi:hypothetical protein
MGETHKPAGRYAVYRSAHLFQAWRTEAADGYFDEKKDAEVFAQGLDTSFDVRVVDTDTGAIVIERFAVPPT